MKETVETLILKDPEALRDYAQSASPDSVRELVKELGEKVLAGKFSVGQPRSPASMNAVMLARLAVNIADGSGDEYVRAQAWCMMAYTLNVNEDYHECLDFYSNSIESFQRIGEHSRAARAR